MVLQTYCGFMSNDKEVQKSSSGGLAAAMAKTVISNGGIVYGVSYTPDFKGAAYVRIDKQEDIDKLKGSKYVKCYVRKEILNSLKQDIESKNKVLFIGLPCDIYVVKEYLNRSRLNIEQLLTVDLICQGPTSQKVIKMYVEHLEKKFGSKVTAFSTRYKNPYWHPPYLYAQFENGKKYVKPFYDTEYGLAFSMMPNESCYSCRFKNKNYRSDITIGDFWGVKNGETGYNAYGSSIAFVHTDAGDKFINSLNNFSLFITEPEKALKRNPRYLVPTAHTNQKDKFKSDFEKHGLFYAASKALTFKQKIIKLIPKKLILSVYRVIKQ